MTKKTEIVKLPNAPLQEVILEVKWELDRTEQNGSLTDSQYDVAVGMLKSEVKDKFPLVKNKFPEREIFPKHFFNYQVLYQYWKGEEVWPVLQLGPGIFTINDTEKNYQWEENYFPLIKDSLNWLENAYESELKYNFASLRYMDRISTKDYKFTNWLEFINNNLNFDIRINFDTKGDLKQFNYNQVYQLENGSDLQISISNGKNNKKEDLLVWEIAINKIASFNKRSLIEWASESHKITHRIFKEICKDELYSSFK